MDLFNKDKLKGLGGSHTPSKGSPKNSPRLSASKVAKLSVRIESPPAVFYGNPSTSSGSLISGQLVLTVTDPEITLTEFKLVLVARATFKKPVSKDCAECKHKDSQLKTWTFLTSPTHRKAGAHSFPFSYLIPGHIPATTHSILGDLEYYLEGKAVTSLNETITNSHPLDIQRALRPGNERPSIRLFPPTNLTIRVVLPSVIHPIGEFPVELEMAGVVDTSLKGIVRRWRVRRINWRIDEQVKIISSACGKHAAKLGGEGKGVLHQETRSLGTTDITSGWKTDFDTQGGAVSQEFTAAIKSNSHPACDVTSPTGLEVSHSMIVEIVVSEEEVGVKGRVIPTGSARVLRMQFKLVVTERSGMGISWDEEQPPLYEDVPNSPPGYERIEDFEGDLDNEETLRDMR